MFYKILLFYKMFETNVCIAVCKCYITKKLHTLYIDLFSIFLRETSC